MDILDGHPDGHPGAVSVILMTCDGQKNGCQKSTWFLIILRNAKTMMLECNKVAVEMERTLACCRPGSCGTLVFMSLIC